MNTENKIKKDNRGGAREGSGGKGRKLAKTLIKEASLERIKQRVYKMSDKLINAQAIVAMGTHKMIVKEKDRVRTITNLKKMQFLIDIGELGKDYFIVSGKDPDYKAANALLDRAFGRATESHEIATKDGEPLIIKLDS